MTTTHWVLIGIGVAVLAAVGLVSAAPHNGGPVVTVRTESVVVTASPEEVVVDATAVGVKAASQAAAAPKRDTTSILLKGFVYALAGVAVSIGLKYLAQIKVLKLDGLRMVATTLISCAGVGTGITALFKDHWFYIVAGASVAFVAAYLIYQLVIKKRITKGA